MADTTATKRDLKDLEKSIDTKLDSKIDELSRSVDGKIDRAVNDLSGIIQNFAQQVSEEFVKVHTRLDKHDADIQRILNHLDAIEKQQEIDDTERKVMAMQLQRLHDWTVKAAKQINVTFEPHK